MTGLIIYIGVLHLYYSHMKVCLHQSKRTIAITLFTSSGAKHLYLLDFSPENLPNLKSTIETTYPDVKVRGIHCDCDIHIKRGQVTTLEADAADEAAISGICEQAIKDEGQLDVFFANAWVPKSVLVIKYSTA